MSISIDIRTDDESESMRWIAAATMDGKPIPHEAKFGGPEVCDELAKKTAEWLEAHQYPVPDHYRLRQVTQEGQEKWVKRPFPK